MSLIYTPIYAAILAILILVLAAKVAMTRRKLRIGVGDKGDKAMLQVVRVHGNATEYVPLGLILMAFAELNAAPGYLVNGAGIALVIGRLIHAYGLGHSIGVSFGRFYGTALTWLVILLLSLYVFSSSLLAIV